ncbi:putative integral membrane protein [Saccharopolyspora erythraea NRRL 2338]|uniref:Uncharacterized protein n=2 Tax=Saccharopolyspora erythraea TaxID=1836 RepID=A4FCL6_SACEN|nr:lipopolysaccharide assembly protein LapA domain-containing protein [Saccharopolyspora erythraea]EQD87464.1 hypothetical protein N599_04245 [Saccharopolyspora erythraea D]PFG95554.1 putative integral membrane protein [Saccharopolyspora erythraea NRRL 2338]QRK92172.1 DUF1049 domain-containing protein [Saccharopolyspora erythraea]CAM01791.1 hypothetical protein SACE_2498 [Saccharopolyspora erythraea NRRL 2338]
MKREEQPDRQKTSGNMGEPGPTVEGVGPDAPAGTRTRVGALWLAVVVAAGVLGLLLVFILQNPATVTVRFLTTQGSMALGVAMLFAAIAGALLIALVATARILQLRGAVRSNRGQGT